MNTPEPPPVASTLSPSAVRVMCAEEMGYVEGPLFNGRRQWKNRPGACWSGVTIKDNFQIPNYPESADAALALVEKMDKGVVLQKVMGGKWECLIGGSMTGHTATAPHPAMAMALAFLKARGRAL